jgi:hypothetical protein
MTPLDDDEDAGQNARRGEPSMTNAVGDANEALALDAPPRVASDEESLAPLLSEATTGGVSMR